MIFENTKLDLQKELDDFKKASGSNMLPELMVAYENLYKDIMNFIEFNNIISIGKDDIKKISFYQGGVYYRGFAYGENNILALYVEDNILKIRHAYIYSDYYTDSYDYNKENAYLLPKIFIIAIEKSKDVFYLV